MRAPRTERLAGEAGFTLVEVLVSLAIFSLAVVGLNRAANLAVTGTADLAARTHAGFVADNAVVEARMAPLDVGTARSAAESGGRTFEVATVTAPTDLPGFFELTVSVSESGRERTIASRRAFRYTAPDTPQAPQSPAGDEQGEP